MNSGSVDPVAAEQTMALNPEALATAANRWRWNLGVFPLKPGGRILDVGCGPCLYWREIVRLGPALYMAADVSESFLVEAQRRLEGQGTGRDAPARPDPMGARHLVGEAGAGRRLLLRRPRAHRTISPHRGPFLLLSNFEYSRQVGQPRARGFGLRATPECEPIRRDSLRLRLCALERPPGTP